MELFSALAIAIHNFPEGLVTFVAVMKYPALGVAIAIHNIPGGIAVSVPIYFATGSRWKVFLYSFFFGLTEMIGAVAGFFLLWPALSESGFGVIFAGVAGSMVYISGRVATERGTLRRTSHLYLRLHRRNGGKST